MVNVQSLIAVATLAATAASANVQCIFKGKVLAESVDSETGVCPWPIPDDLPVNFKYTSPEEYLVDAYYWKGDDKYWNDIRNEGRIINLPMAQIVNKKLTGFFHVHKEKTPDANSTLSLRKRLFKEEYLIKRDEIDDFITNEVQTEDGEEVPDDSINDFEFPPAVESSSSEEPTSTDASDKASATGSDEASATGSDEGSATGSAEATEGSATGSAEATESGEGSATGSAEATEGSATGSAEATKSGEGSATGSAEATEGSEEPIETITTTQIHTKTETIIKCDDNKCHTTTQKQTQGPVTTTDEQGKTITTTEWCAQETVIIETYDEQCGCSKKVPATEGVVTTTIYKSQKPQVVEVITWCPVPSQVIVTETVCYNNKCHQTEVVATPTNTKQENNAQVTDYHPVDQFEHPTQGQKTITVTVCHNNQCETSVVPCETQTQVTQSGNQIITLTSTVPVYVTTLSSGEKPPAGHTTYVAANPAPTGAAPAPTQAAPAPTHGAPEAAPEGQHPQVITTTVYCNGEACQPAPTNGAPIPEGAHPQVITTTVTAAPEQQPQPQGEKPQKQPQQQGEQTTLAGEERPAPLTTKGPQVEGPAPAPAAPTSLQSQTVESKPTSPVITGYEGAASGLSVAKGLIALACAAPLFL
ncbi:hypothetical protein DIURU_003521 [Diutina rugosa]|uniref:Flo11 domain-containing protein n=1 Tax=Diutina rugosa TaxID=5481 RepID=A0A642ULB8_DIURU|nr:uncharacterized protein DIURU_003521 [Diutina rugosa]KAA8901151.1 hypothetical protein DIURU_003521 [Diutina rugosa]